MNLLVRPKPEKGESFIGYLVRLTELNAYDTPSWILSLADIDYMELQWTFSFVFGKSPGLEKLADLTDNTVSDLQGLIYPPSNVSQGKSEYDHDFYGASLNRSIIRPHHPKICPKCLAEFGYCFRIWECSLVTACPTHECMLFDRCPSCRRQIRAIRKSISICTCGCDWREIEPKSVTAREMSVSRRVNDLCKRRPKEKGSAHSKNPLNTLNLRDFIAAITFVVRCGRKISWATGRPSKSIKLSNSDLHELYAHAHSVFDNWPNNYFQFLKNQSRGLVRLQSHDGKLDTALKREFGSFYEYLYQNLDKPQFDFMRESFAEFLTARLKSQCEEVRSEPLSLHSHGTDSYISMANARRLLRISHHAMSDLIASGEVGFGIRNHGKNLEYVLCRSDIENLKCKFEQSLSTRDLAKELGVDCEAVRELARAGHLRTRCRPAVDGYHTMKFDRDSVLELLNIGLVPSDACRNRPVLR
jgi:hypothetical protein